MRLVMIQGNRIAVYVGREQVAVFETDGADRLGAEWIESLRTSDIQPIELS